MLDWLGVEGDLIADAFERVFRRPGTPFGSAALHWGGLHDGNEGVQWNVGLDPRGPERWIGVNLEGMKYNGWPIARLIAKELKRATLPDFVASRRELETVHLVMERDFWGGRFRVHFEKIADAPLRDVTEAEWRRVLTEARSCLGSPSGGRGRRTFTPKTGRGLAQDTEVTPHLTFRLSVPVVDSWERFIREGIGRLDPLYEWTEQRVAA
ncbi:MAG: hypothetical protein ACJ8GN_27845 [Longimicrobiaceae bacterium]